MANNDLKGLSYVLPGINALDTMGPSNSNETQPLISRENGDFEKSESGPPVDKFVSF